MTGKTVEFWNDAPCIYALFLLLSPVVNLDSTLVISQDQEPLG